MSTKTVEYPEHEKLRAISEDSQTIGHFLDTGLAAQNLVIYERFEEPCECHQCRVHETEAATGLHCDADDVRNGQAIYTRYRPTMKRIEQILADHFDIDLEKIEKEKDEMYQRIKAMNS